MPQNLLKMLRIGGATTLQININPINRAHIFFLHPLNKNKSFYLYDLIQLIINHNKKLTPKKMPINSVYPSSIIEKSSSIST